MLTEDYGGQQASNAPSQPLTPEDELPPSLRRFEVSEDGLPTDGNDLAGFGLNVQQVE